MQKMEKKFTTPCFIRKNTPELRKKLEELGYEINSHAYIPFPVLFTDPNDGLFSGTLEVGTRILMEGRGCIDCGENEALFLALAALNDTDDYMQWFVDLLGEWSLSAITTGYSSDLCWHKATPSELIEHFNK